MIFCAWSFTIFSRLWRYLLSRGLFTEELTPEYIEDLCKAAPLHVVLILNVADNGVDNLAAVGGVLLHGLKLFRGQPAGLLQDGVRDFEYPTGLTETNIPLSARIMAVADVFDALYEERC